MRLLRSSSVTPNCAPSRRICWHRAQLRGGAVLAAAGQADAPGSNRRARPLRRLCGSRAQTSPHRPKGPRRRRGCNRREPAVPDAARGDRPRPALAPRRASRACYRLPSFARKGGRHAPRARSQSNASARAVGRGAILGRHASAPSGRVRTTATAGGQRQPAAAVEPSRDRPECGRADPSPTATSIRARAPCERTTGRRRRPPRNRAARYRRPPEAPWSSSTSSRRPVELGATTWSACLLHGLLPASPQGPRELRHARRPQTVEEEKARPTRLLVVASRRLAGAGPDARVSSAAGVSGSATRRSQPGQGAAARSTPRSAASRGKRSAVSARSW